MTAATSLIMGLAIRNEKVTPSGMPASTKPMNSGTEEQEQNGVTAPSETARPTRLPVGSPAHEGPHPLRSNDGTQQAHDIDDRDQQDKDLRHVHDEELHGSARPGGRLELPAGQRPARIGERFKHGPPACPIQPLASTSGSLNDSSAAASTKPADHHRQPLSPWVW